MISSNEIEVFENKIGDARVFDYALNKKRAKAKLLKGAKRENLIVEVKNGCVNLLFSDGAYIELVLPLMKSWNKKVNKVFEINNTQIKVIEIDTGIEESGNHVDTKLVIMANNQRFVLHAYNGTQNLMVQGKNYEQFAVNCLQPFFQQKIQESLDIINKNNANIKEALSNKELEVPKQVNCPQCEVRKTTKAELKVHMKTCHTKPSLSSPQNKIPKILNENVSLHDISDQEMEKLDEEKIMPLLEDAISCDLCDFDPKSIKELEDHVKSIHINLISEENEFNLHLGQKHIMNEEQNDDKIKSSTPKKQSASTLGEENVISKVECNKCTEMLSSQESLDDHLKEKHKLMNTYNCTTCEFNTTVLRNFENHVITTHTMENASITCEICGVELETIADLEKHKNKEHVLLRSRCGNCDLVFENIGALTEHQKSKHDTPEPRKAEVKQSFYCDRCNLQCDSLKAIEEHNRIHDLPVYKCDKCDLVSCTIEELWIHKITFHEGYKALTPEGTQGMQQTLILSLSGMLEYLVENMAKLKATTIDGIQESKNKMEGIEKRLKNIEDNLMDTKVAMSKTARFDEKIQNDGIAVLKNFTDRCSSLENIILEKKTKAEDTEAIHNKDEHVDKDVKKTCNEDFYSKRTLKHKVKWVGTSISKVLDKKKVEKDLDVELTSVKAYCVSKEGRYPDQNFKEVVAETLEDGEVDTLVLEAGSIEITNIDVNKAVMNTEKSIEESKKEWFDKAEETSKAIFQIAEESVAKNKKLNVVIVKRLQRFDKTSSDIIGIKQKISDFANKIYDQCILKSSNSSRIHLMELNLTRESKHLKDIIYGRTDNQRYDGIHLSGEAASRHFSYRVVQSFKQILQTPGQPKIRPSQYSSSESESSERRERISESHGHTNCPQAQYQRIQRGKRAHVSRQYATYASVVKSNTRGDQIYNFSIPTRNRFDQLSNQGNW